MNILNKPKKINTEENEENLIPGTSSLNESCSSTASTISQRKRKQMRKKGALFETGKQHWSDGYWPTLTPAQRIENMKKVKKIM